MGWFNYFVDRVKDNLIDCFMSSCVVPIPVLHACISEAFSERVTLYLQPSNLEE